MYRLTDELTDGDLLWKRTLRTGLVLPAIGHTLARPEKLCVEETEGSDERGGQPPQAGTPDGIRVDADDRKEDGKPCGPNDCVKGHGHEVVCCDAVEPGEVGRVFYVHEHSSKLDEQTGESQTVSVGSLAVSDVEGMFTREGRGRPTRRPTSSETCGGKDGARSCIWPQSRRQIL